MTGQVRAAEFVFPGHPDKLADAIADALVQDATRRERRALVGVEVAVHRDSVFITGRIGCRNADRIDVTALVRDVYRSAGYGGAWDPVPDRLRIEMDLCAGALAEGEAESRSLADDQSICVGYAVAIPATNYLPVEQWLANRLGRRIAALRLERPDLYLGPDGKILIVVNRTHLWKVQRVGCSLQQRDGADEIALNRAVRQALGAELTCLSREWPALSAAAPEAIHVNGAGAFEIGGPMGDNGLSGKKLVVDAYGPAVPIGGGALSGKDFFKADRAGALHARRIAKAIAMTGQAAEATVTLEWLPGGAAASVLTIAGDGGKPLDAEGWAGLFDLSLESSGHAWTNATDLVDVARYGHFISPDRPWEEIHIAPRLITSSRDDDGVRAT